MPSVHDFCHGWVFSYQLFPKPRLALVPKDFKDEAGRRSRARRGWGTWVRLTSYLNASLSPDWGGVCATGNQSCSCTVWAPPHPACWACRVCQICWNNSGLQRMAHHQWNTVPRRCPGLRHLRGSAASGTGGCSLGLSFFSFTFFFFLFFSVFQMNGDRQPREGQCGMTLGNARWYVLSSWGMRVEDASSSGSSGLVTWCHGHTCMTCSIHIS